MQTNLKLDVLGRVMYLTGSADIAAQLLNIPAKIAFDDSILDFLDHVSKVLMKNKDAKAYPDVVTFGF